MFLFKKAKKGFNNLRHHRGNVNAAGSTPELRNIAQDSHVPRNSKSDVSAMSVPIQMNIQGNPVFHRSQLATEGQVPQESSIQHQALQTAGAVAETGIKILKELSDIIPVAGQGLGIALGVVSECIQIYHANNKEQFNKLSEELSTKLAEVKQYMQQSRSTEMDQVFQTLAKKLGRISSKASPQQNKNWLAQVLEKTDKIVSADKISQEITSYFEDIKNAFDACQRKVLFRIERNTSDISQDIYLKNLNPSKEAFYDYQVGRPACTPETRVEILEKIMKWANTTSEDQVYWIGGMAGTGKSTIAKSLCDAFEKENLAGAFFCSRQLEACRDHTRIIPTIAYQLAKYSQTFAEALTKELEKD
ncbi:hypothetical protein GYMLUDRAFT_248679 [Collybiopsis luxurians FD-317 M1]|uniref:Nephrocystin 3-like N-terminal domain-containing protein n=1 Tax=Collybiopsis luxurians FD-317 M1 TaxID=944289 RepID=A0A0D0CBK7_9AGAR|nr:hypothetical protein GYMLUDRAFT_248679 [Collybiopsis luxurians FD-317 M1]